MPDTRPAQTPAKRRARGRAVAAPGSWLVYILRCADGSLYTGITNDLEGRLARHNSGRGAAYTRARRPVSAVYCEPACDRSAALRREAAIKRLTRAEKLALIGAASSAAGRRRAKRAGPGRPGTGRGRRA